MHRYVSSNKTAPLFFDQISKLVLFITVNIFVKLRVFKLKSKEAINLTFYRVKKFNVQYNLRGIQTSCQNRRQKYFRQVCWNEICLIQSDHFLVRSAYTRYFIFLYIWITCSMIGFVNLLHIHVRRLKAFFDESNLSVKSSSLLALIDNCNLLQIIIVLIENSWMI